jgi:hypothetical protein
VKISTPGVVMHAWRHPKEDVAFFPRLDNDLPQSDCLATIASDLMDPKKCLGACKYSATKFEVKLIGGIEQCVYM